MQHVYSSEKFDGDRAMYLLQTYAKQIVTIAALLLAAIVALAFYFTRTDSQIEENYLAAENYFAAINKYSEEKSFPKEAFEESLQKLTALLSRRSDLQAKYDGKLAQLLIALNMSDKAEPLMLRTWERVKTSNLQHLEPFGLVTSSIDGSQFEEAFSDNQKLLDSFSASIGTTQPLLTSYSALRQAFLAGAIAPQSAETERLWNELLLQIDSQSGSSSSLTQIASSFTDGNITLADYIKSLLPK